MAFIENNTSKKQPHRKLQNWPQYFHLHRKQHRPTLGCQTQSSIQRSDSVILSFQRNILLSLLGFINIKLQPVKVWKFMWYLAFAFIDSDSGEGPN